MDFDHSEDVVNQADIPLEDGGRLNMSMDMDDVEEQPHIIMEMVNDEVIGNHFSFKFSCDLNNSIGLVPSEYFDDGSSRKIIGKLSMDNLSRLLTRYATEVVNECCLMVFQVATFQLNVLN